MKVLTKEQLLEKAYKDYPIGTKFISPFNEMSIRRIELNPIFIMSGNSVLYDDNYVYFRGNWGKIISKPKEIYEIY